MKNVKARLMISKLVSFLKGDSNNKIVAVDSVLKINEVLTFSQIDNSFKLDNKTIDLVDLVRNFENYLMNAGVINMNLFENGIIKDESVTRYYAIDYRLQDEIIAI